MRFDVIVVVKFVIRDSPEFQDMKKYYPVKEL